MTSRSWCFTLNLKDADEATASAVYQMESMKLRAMLDDFRYLIFSLELSTSGTYHLQGYIEFSTPQRMTRVKHLISVRCHCERRRGSREKARDYCRKVTDPTFIEGPCIIGTWVAGQGDRQDLSNVQAMLDDNAPLVAVAEAHFGSFVRYHRGFSLYRELIAGRRRHLTELHVYIGYPGCGKSRMVFEKYPDAYWKPPGNSWFPLYEGEEDAIFDDFNGAWFSVQTLLRLCDRYPLMTDVKGGHSQFLAKRIHITSNNSIRDWYNWDRCKSPMSALSRRVTKLVCCPPTMELMIEWGLTSLLEMKIFEIPAEFPIGWESFRYQ